MPLSLVLRVRTQDQGWPFQEVHHCDTHVMVTCREKNVRIYTDLTTKLLTTANSHAAANDSNLRRRRPLTSSDHFPLAEEMTAVAMRPGAPHAPSTGDTNMLEETKEKKSFKIVTYVRFSSIYSQWVTGFEKRERRNIQEFRPSCSAMQ